MKDVELLQCKLRCLTWYIHQKRLYSHILYSSMENICIYVYMCIYNIYLQLTMMWFIEIKINFDRDMCTSLINLYYIICKTLSFTIGYTHTYRHTCTHVYADTNIHIYTLIKSSSTHTNIHIYTHMHMCIHTYKHIHAYTHMHI